MNILQRSVLFLAAAAASAAPLTAAASSDEKMDGYIDRLMAKMTLREKIGQLNLCGAGDVYTGPVVRSNIAERIRKGEVGGILSLKGVDYIRSIQEVAVKESRLGIPVIFGKDVIHGYETVFPIPLGVSCSWDLEAIERSARIAAVEASADGICWTYSPMVDICRDARWGRMSEGSGEDVFLGSRIAEAMVRGYQGDNTYRRRDQVMACVKHFALYGASDGGRDYNTADMSRLRMYNEYMPPYKAAIDAGVGSVMSAFNVVDGIPATGNRWLLTDLLRRDWGFDGFVVSDASSVVEMCAHGMGDTQQVAALAVNAGLDMDLGSEAFMRTLEKSVAEGRVSIEQIDQACRRVLEAKYKLGLFKNPYKYCDVSRPAKEVYTPEHRAFARRLATETFVLMKNDNRILPLRKEGKIALIGPFLTDCKEIQGTWSPSGATEKYTTILDAFRTATGDRAELLYARGCGFEDEADEEQIRNYLRDKGADFAYRPGTPEDADEAVRIASEADVVVAFLGEHEMQSGESSSRSELTLAASQRALRERLLQTGKPVVLVYFMGRPVVMDWETEHVPAILNVWFPGSEAGDAIADVLFGDVNPSGKLTTSFPRSVGQIPIHYDELPTGRPLPEGSR
ncbi:MAG: beta-glucosidase BglX, partial [Alistipes sp.]|nr:beta-glucosidase BglX [Alistipes sp.]